MPPAGTACRAACSPLAAVLPVGRTMVPWPARYEGLGSGLLAPLNPTPLLGVGRLLVGDSGRMTASALLLLGLLGRLAAGVAAAPLLS